MTVSQKQLEANRKNARKGGVKTAEGKALAKYNALKHGLLAREVVVAVGEGAEDPAEFAALAQRLKDQFQPQGPLEEMLVEKLAVAYWRLRRSYRYEAGLVRRELDTAAERFHRLAPWDGQNEYRTEEQIDGQIEQEKAGIAYWQKDQTDLSRMRKDGTTLESLYDWDPNWEALEERVADELANEVEYEGAEGPQELREYLNGQAGWSDDRIWQGLIEVCDERAERHRRRVAALEQEKQDNRRRLEVFKMLGNVPAGHELDRLLRYEGAIERQFYKALNQLERLQRLRSGDEVPAPVEVDVNLNAGETA